MLFPKYYNSNAPTPPVNIGSIQLILQSANTVLVGM